MFKDDDLWPIRCPYCANQFHEKIASLKAGSDVVCPDCKTRLWFPPEQFERALDQARQGVYDFTRDGIVRVKPGP